MTDGSRTGSCCPLRRLLESFSEHATMTFLHCKPSHSQVPALHPSGADAHKSAGSNRVLERSFPCSFPSTPLFPPFVFPGFELPSNQLRTTLLPVNQVSTLDDCDEHLTSRQSSELCGRRLVRVPRHSGPGSWTLPLARQHVGRCAELPSYHRDAFHAGRSRCRQAQGHTLSVLRQPLHLPWRRCPPGQVSNLATLSKHSPREPG